MSNNTERKLFVYEDSAWNDIPTCVSQSFSKSVRIVIPSFQLLYRILTTILQLQRQIRSPQVKIDEIQSEEREEDKTDTEKNKYYVDRNLNSARAVFMRVVLM